MSGTCGKNGCSVLRYWESNNPLLLISTGSDFCKGQEQAGCLDSHNLQSGFGDTHVQQTWNIDSA